MLLNSSSVVTTTLRWASGLMFLGKFLLCAWSISPVVEFLGYESVMRPLVNLFMPWEDYAIDVYPWFSEVAAWKWTVVYGLTTVVLLGPRKWHLWIIPGIVFVVLDTLMAAPGQYYWPISILEQTLMWATPICYLSVCYTVNDKVWIPMARYAIVIVFFIHGLLAVGIIPRPGYWDEMLGQTTGLSNTWAIGCLQIIGLLDILVASALFFRLDLPRYVWFYLIGWGLLTALGRVSGYIGSADWFDLLFNWSYETLLRLPHGLTPLALFLAVSDRN